MSLAAETLRIIATGTSVDGSRRVDANELRECFDGSALYAANCRLQGDTRVLQSHFQLGVFERSNTETDDPHGPDVASTRGEMISEAVSNIL